MPRDFQSTPVRVVIVDDHRLFVDALALLLGHDDRLTVIGTAGDGRTAIEIAVAEEAREVGAVALLTKGALHEELKEAILAAAPQQLAVN